MKILKVCVAAVAATTSVRGEDAQRATSFEVGADFMSSYVYRGQIYGEKPVWQPYVTIAYDAEEYGKLIANVWSCNKLTNQRDGNPVHHMGNEELDYTIAYARSFGDWGLKIGNSWYVVPMAGNTEELFVSVTWNNPIVTPSVTAYWDYYNNDDADMLYGVASLRHEWSITEKLTITPSASLGMADDSYLRRYAWGLHKTAFLDQTSGIVLGYAYSQHLYLGLDLNYTWIVDRDARRANYMGEGKCSWFYYGFFIIFTY